MKGALRGEAVAPFRVVFLDCDSTLSAIEGIDELARATGVADEVEALTRQAMEGGVSLESVYGLRLGLVRPSAEAVRELGELYLARIVEGAAELVAALHALGKEAHVISGGVRQALLPLAERLGIVQERVHAVGLRFDDTGAYAGFDETSPLWKSGGKARACALVLGTPPARAAIVGDGKTDLEARPPCAVMIGFGGVAARDVVRTRADAWVEGPSLLPALRYLLTPAEAERLEEIPR